MLVGTDVWVRMVFVWEETGVPGGNPSVRLGDQMTISHADVGYRTWVAVVRGECVNTARQLRLIVKHNYMHLSRRTIPKTDLYYPFKFAEQDVS